MDEMWKRLKEWFADGMGLFALLAAGLFVYLWAEDGPRAALLMATVFAVLFISVRLCGNLWMALLLRKKFRQLILSYSFWALRASQQSTPCLIRRWRLERRLSASLRPRLFLSEHSRCAASSTIHASKERFDEMPKSSAGKAPASKPALKKAAKASASVKAAEALIKYALTFPEAVLEHPWGHDAVKVKGKMFATFGGEIGEAGELSMTVKLPVSAEMALGLPWVEKTGYGLGKSGWVTARVTHAKDIDLETLKGWIDQSYRAVASKGCREGTGLKLGILRVERGDQARGSGSGSSCASSSGSVRASPRRSRRLPRRVLLPSPPAACCAKGAPMRAPSTWKAGMWSQITLNMISSGSEIRPPTGPQIHVQKLTLRMMASGFSSIRLPHDHRRHGVVLDEADRHEGKGEEGRLQQGVVGR